MSKNTPLSEAALTYMAKMFPCTKPCDSYGVCEGCLDSSLFQAGYNFGYRADRENPSDVEVKLVSKDERTYGFLKSQKAKEVQSSDARTQNVDAGKHWCIGNGCVECSAFAQQDSPPPGHERCNCFNGCDRCKGTGWTVSSKGDVK